MLRDIVRDNGVLDTFGGMCIHHYIQLIHIRIINLAKKGYCSRVCVCVFLCVHGRVIHGYIMISLSVHYYILKST